MLREALVNLHFFPQVTIAFTHASAVNVNVAEARSFCTEAGRRNGYLVCFFILQNKGRYSRLVLESVSGSG